MDDLNVEIIELKQNITQEKKTNSDITHKNHMLNNQIKDIKIQSESQKNKMQNIIDDLEDKMNQLKQDNNNAYT